MIWPIFCLDTVLYFCLLIVDVIGHVLLLVTVLPFHVILLFTCYPFFRWSLLQHSEGVSMDFVLASFLLFHNSSLSNKRHLLDVSLWSSLLNSFLWYLEYLAVISGTKKKLKGSLFCFSIYKKTSFCQLFGPHSPGKFFSRLLYPRQDSSRICRFFLNNTTKINNGKCY